MSIASRPDRDQAPTGSSSRRALLYLSSSVLQVVLAFVALPLATSILGPADYGVYALVTSVALAVGTIGDLGQNILFSGHYMHVKAAERRSMLSSVLAVSLAMAFVALLVFVAAWPWVTRTVGVDREISGHILWVAALCIPLRAVNSIVSQYCAVANRSGTAALLIGVQAIGTFVVTMVTLFVFHLDVLSLFLGSAAGMFLAATVAVILLRDDLVMSVQFRWIRALFRVAPSSVLAAAGDSVRTAVENFLMARFVGVGQVGLWAHSRQYYGLLLQGTNALAYVLWPRALDEACKGERFEVVGRAWNVVYLWLVLAGVFFALFGREVVSILTNGKFVDAAVWIPVWVAYLLLQNSGKAATATVYATKKGVWAANFRIITLVPCVPALWFLVPRAGIAGVMVVLFAEMLLFRILIAYSARKIRRIPFQDGWVLAGSALVTGLGWFVANTSLGLSARVLLLVLVGAGVMIAGQRAFGDGIAQLRTALRGADAIIRAGGQR